MEYVGWDQWLYEWLDQFQRDIDPIDLDRQAFDEMDYDHYQMFRNWSDYFSVGEILDIMRGEGAR